VVVVSSVSAQVCWFCRPKKKKKQAWIDNETFRGPGAEALGWHDREKSIVSPKHYEITHIVKGWLSLYSRSRGASVFSVSLETVKKKSKSIG